MSKWVASYDALEKQKLLDKTLLIVTADHGGQANEYFLGAGNGKSYAGSIESDGGAKDQPHWVQHLLATGKIKVTYQDSAIRTWISEDNAEARTAVKDAIAQMTGVTEVYEKIRDNKGAWTYHSVYSNLPKQTHSFQAWAKAHSLELVNTMASDIGPDFVGLLADGAGYGLLGDHGGAQEKVQRVPLFVHQPGKAAGVDAKALRHMDLAGIVRKVMGL